MICFNCGVTMDGADDKQCKFCGVKFAQRCPSCKVPNPFMAKFCFQCGSSLARISSESSIQNFGTLGEARKNVAVMFADISGFTALSEKMDPEEVRDIINDCFSYITKPVYELEGMIDKYIGDCVMVLFGAKVTHSDDAKRAVACGLKMMELIKEFSEERLSARGVSLDLSIGIHYGLVVTGSVGNLFDKDYTVMGDTVNTAQRLQYNADRGSILVSESVYMETRDEVNYSKPMEIMVKNKENPVRCYLPLGVDAERFLEKETFFIERPYEMNFLQSVLRDAMNRSTRYVTVIGEMGVGKTSVLKAFASTIGNRVKKVWVDLSSAATNHSYFAISSILIAVMNINEQDGKDIKQNRLVSFIDYILKEYPAEERKRNYDFLGLVLGLDRDREFQNLLNSMSVENVRREVLRQLVVFFKGLCKKHKLFVVVDDIHWCDTNSMEIISKIKASLANSKALFVFSSRYGIEELQAVSDVLKIPNLDTPAMRQLTCAMLQCEGIDENFEAVLLKFSKGNPLYVKEFVANVKRSGSYAISEGIAYLNQELKSLPGSIQGLVLANLSYLDENTKNFLQVASALGKDFLLSFVKRLVDFGGDLESVLDASIQWGMISKKSVFTSSGMVEKVFTFNHDIEREVIYDSILNKSKKDIHRKTGQYIEERYQKEIGDYYEDLCAHFERAEVWNKALEYAYKAAIKQKNEFNFESSLRYYKKFLEKVEQYFPEDDRKMHAFQDMGYIYFLTAEYAQAMVCYHKALQEAQLSDDIYSIKIRMAGVYKEQDKYEDALALLNAMMPIIKPENNVFGKLLEMKLGILRILGDPEAEGLIGQSESVLTKTGDFDSLSEVMNQAGILYFTKGDIDPALIYLNKSYQYAEKVNNLAVMAKVSGNLGIIYYAIGMVSKAFEALRHSMDGSRKISDQQGVIAGCINLGILYLDKGLFDKAQELFEESLEISRELGSKLNECVNMTNLGDLMVERGLYERALAYYQESLAIAEEIHVPLGEAINNLGLARTYLEMGLPDQVGDRLESAYEIFSTVDGAEYIVDYYRHKSLYALLKNNMPEALTWCEKAIEASVEYRSDRRKLKALRLKGDLLIKLGRVQEVLRIYDEAILLAQQLESDIEAAKGYFARSKALRMLGREGESARDGAKAKECIQRVDACRWRGVIEVESFKGNDAQKR